MDKSYRTDRARLLVFSLDRRFSNWGRAPLEGHGMYSGGAWEDMEEGEVLSTFYPHQWITNKGDSSRHIRSSGGAVYLTLDSAMHFDGFLLNLHVIIQSRCHLYVNLFAMTWCAHLSLSINHNHRFAFALVKMDCWQCLNQCLTVFNI